MPISPRKMPFMQHVAELRKRITIAVLTVVVLSGVFYIEPLYVGALNVFLAPVREFLPDGMLVVTGPFEALTFRFKVSMFAAILAGSPIIIYQIMAFMMPALKERERKWLVPTASAAIALFLSGAAFAYFVILAPAFEWLTSQRLDAAGNAIVDSIPTADRYFSGIGMMLVGFGVGFELPLAVFYLIGFGILPYDKARAAWRYAYVIIITVAAAATPDWSPWTMGGLAAALIVLYELSLLVARLVFREKIAEQRADAAERAAEAEADEIEARKEESREARRAMLQSRAEAARKREAEAQAKASGVSAEAAPAESAE